MIYLNGDTVNVTMFPDNTSQVWKLDEKNLIREIATIKWEFSHEGEIVHLAQLNSLLTNYVKYMYLHIDYLPYGRQDKLISNNSTFALWPFARIINMMEFDEISIMDPHSQVVLSAIKNSRAVYPHNSLNKAINTTSSNLICYPDNGALIKYIDAYNLRMPYIYGEKVRDQETGYITSYKLVGDCYGKRVLIVDDICDGGKTFELLANDLYTAGANEVNLFVTHGLFTKGLRPLRTAGIRRIFTNKGEAFRMPDGGLGFRNEY